MNRLILKYYNLLSALSLSLDILERRNFGHARRVAYVAIRIANEMNIEKSNLNKIFYSSFLHDIGKNDVYDDFTSNESWKHSLRGSMMVEGIPYGKDLSDIIKYHHENYDGSGHFGLYGKSIPLASQIIYISDQFDIKYNTLSKKIKEYDLRELIKSYLSKESSKSFSPEIVKVIMELMKQEKFWLDYEYYDTLNVLKPYISDDIVTIDINELKNVADVFSNIVDNKSHFTYKHSKNVSTLAYKAAIAAGYDKNTIEKIKIAGLLHDLGKLAIPNSVLDKPGKLTTEEFRIIKSHTYYTKKILKEIGDIDDIAEWAANHHEKLDGSGYPEGLTNEKLDDISKIMAICDMYQALTENRPYRVGMKQNTAIDIIYESVKSGKLDGNALEILKEAIK